MSHFEENVVSDWTPDLLNNSGDFTRPLLPKSSIQKITHSLLFHRKVFYWKLCLVKNSLVERTYGKMLDFKMKVFCWQAEH